MSPDQDPSAEWSAVTPGDEPTLEAGAAVPVVASAGGVSPDEDRIVEAGAAVPDEEPAPEAAVGLPAAAVGAAACRTTIGYAVRVRSEEAPSVSELFDEVEEAHARFGDLAVEHPKARVSLYGPGGSLIRRRPSNADRCAFCGEPASGAWPVTGLGTDTATRRRDVLALCPQHHAGVTGSEGGMVFGPWRWHPGHSMA